MSLEYQRLAPRRKRYSNDAFDDDMQFDEDEDDGDLAKGDN